jgi:hypothetical protein
LRAPAEAIERGGGRVRRAAADACLDQLYEGPLEEPGIVLFAALLGDRESIGVAAEAVVEQRRGPLQNAQPQALAPCRRLEPPSLE